MPFLTAAAIMMPFFWSLASGRRSAGIISLSYFLAASRGLPCGAGIFFTASSPAWYDWALWAIAGGLNALPWALLWHADPRRRMYGGMLAILITSLPPIGWIGWVNPMTVAGWFYPGMRFIGLVLTAGLIAALTICRWPVVVMLLAAAGLANVEATIWPQPPMPALAKWSAMNTDLPRLQSASGAGDAQRVIQVLQLARALPAGQVLLLPETILPSQDPDSFAWFMLHQASRRLSAEGSTIIAGTEDPRPGLPIKNELVTLGAGAPLEMVQRIPVPIGMWRPWKKVTFAVEPFGSGIVQLRRLQVAYSICYEQLLTYPVLVSMAHAPQVLIGAANDWWARNTSIPTIQGECLDLWGRLFGIPVIRSTNI